MITDKDMYTEVLDIIRTLKSRTKDEGKCIILDSTVNLLDMIFKDEK